MSQSSLYINAKGYGVNRHSYSGSQEFSHCARLYYLKRVAGYSEIKKSAAMEFGNSVEAGHKEFHRHGIEAALKAFTEKWATFKDAELDYSDKLENWEACFLTGQEMLKLYAIKYPKMDFVIPNPEALQVQRSYEIFPGSELAGIELISYMDIVAKLKPGRFAPDLPDSRVILDMKVSAAVCPTLISLDPQLRTYSMVEKIPTVGFLWFGVKSRSLKKGDAVTVLEDIGSYKAGYSAYVLSDDKGDIPIVPPSIYIVNTYEAVEAFESTKGSSKAAVAERASFVEKNGTPAPISILTRQEIDVRMATISDESREDMRKQIEQDVVRIHAASENDFWPMQGGVRFPNNKCTMCAMRGICSGNDKLRDELVVRIQEDVL